MELQSAMTQSSGRYAGLVLLDLAGGAGAHADAMAEVARLVGLAETQAAEHGAVCWLQGRRACSA